MLCALLLPTNTTAAELFKSLKLHIRKTELVILCWSVHTVVAMTRWLSCFTTWVKEIAFKCESIYTVIHREMLASWKVSPELNNVCRMWLNDQLHYSARSSRLFMQFCEEMDAEHTHFLCTKKWEDFLKVDHWPVFEVQEMHQRFLAAPFSDTEETANLAYLCDILNLLNELNLGTWCHWDSTLYQSSCSLMYP